MTEAALAISLSNPSVSARDCLKLEQEPWGKDIGETTNMQGILGIAAAINGGKWPEVRCGGLNGIFTATVYAYPCNLELAFQVKISHGTVVNHIVETKYREEIIQCSLQLEATPDYPVRSVGVLAWMPGGCCDSKGNPTSRPTVEVVDGVIHFSKAVYGSLRFRYTVIRHEYKVEVSRRLNAIENKYQSVVYAVWDGGVTWLDIDAPANFEAFDGDCGNGAFYDDGDGNGLQDGYDDGQLSQTDICKAKYSKLPVAVRADRKIKVDYCGQETTSDTISEIDDYDVIKEECND